jgi:8-amino-7-oxononanoate synthase
LVRSSLADELKSLDDQQLKRSLKPVEQTEPGRLFIQGRSLLNFSSNNYLGLARHPRVIEAVKEVLDHWGAGATSSRLIGGTAGIHRDLEDALAAFMRTDAALVFPTGYMANLGVITALAGDGDAVILDRLCHASLIDAARLSGARLFVYGHADVAEAERVLERAASYRRRLLVSDSLFSMDGDFAPLNELAALARRYDAISILDEAHAVGVWGDGGRGARVKNPPIPPLAKGGSDEEGSIEGGFDVVVGTLSKSLGSQGGFVCGTQDLIDTLVNKARSFIYTTGLSPACVTAAHAALSLIQEDLPAGRQAPSPRERVVRLSQQLRDGLNAAGFDTLRSSSQIVPILLGSVERALSCSAQLEASGIYAPAIRPPTVHDGECRIRFSVTAEHTEEDIQHVLNALEANPPNPPLSKGGK